MRKISYVAFIASISLLGVSSINSSVFAAPADNSCVEVIVINHSNRDGGSYVLGANVHDNSSACGGDGQSYSIDIKDHINLGLSRNGDDNLPTRIHTWGIGGKSGGFFTIPGPEFSDPPYYLSCGGTVDNVKCYWEH